MQSRDAYNSCSLIERYRALTVDAKTIANAVYATFVEMKILIIRPLRG